MKKAGIRSGLVFGVVLGWALLFGGGASGEAHRLTAIEADYALHWPQVPVCLDGRCYFTVSEELWRSDGTAEGTGPVGFPTGVGPIVLLTSTSQHVFFYEKHARPNKLWCTDGTDAGTISLGDFHFRHGASRVGYAVVGGDLYFASIPNDTLMPSSLWYTKGRPETTIELASFEDTWSWMEAQRHPTPNYLSPAGGGIVFSAYSDNAGYELWYSGGTAETTALLKDILPSPDGYPGSLSSSIPNQMRPLEQGGALFFATSTGFGGPEKWFTEGTAAGTFAVPEINSILPVWYKDAYFMEWMGAFKRIQVPFEEAVPIMNLPKSSGTGSGYQIKAAAVSTTQLVLALHTNENGLELWRSDGTAEGTQLLIDLNPGPSSGVRLEYYPDVHRAPGLVTANGRVYFPGDDGSGPALWSTDGSAPGTRMESRVAPAESGYYEVNGRLLFMGNDGENGREAYAVDLLSAAVEQEPAVIVWALLGGGLIIVFGATVVLRNLLRKRAA